MNKAWIICYDIADPKRLARVHRYLRGKATQLQYSVYWLEGSKEQHRACMDPLTKMIKPAQDDLRSYPIPAHGLKLKLGKAPFPEGIVWHGDPFVPHNMEQPHDNT